MIITDDFIMLNFPKTGSTFARTAIKDIYVMRLENRTRLQRGLQRTGLQKKPFIKELILPNTRIPGNSDPHGTYSQIPDEFRDRRIVSVIRNPYDRFMSLYEFNWWTGRSLFYEEIVKQHIPNYPEMSVDDFVAFNKLTVIHGRMGGKIPQADVGDQTMAFIQIFFKDPERVLSNLTDNYLDSEQVFLDIADITFLRQENLNEELSSFLLSCGYTQEEARYVRNREKVHVTKKRGPDRKDLWTPNALEYVSKYERMMFRILESKGIHYEPPAL